MRINLVVIGTIATFLSGARAIILLKKGKQLKKYCELRKPQPKNVIKSFLFFCNI